jgi:hypothetical protein
MQIIRIETVGLGPKEVRDLAEVVRRMEGVSDVQWTPYLSGQVEKRSLPQASVQALHLIVRLVEPVATAIGTIALNHVYKRVGEGIVDRAWDSVKARLSGESVVEVGVKLYGPDGELIREHRGKR